VPFLIDKYDSIPPIPENYMTQINKYTEIYFLQLMNSSIKNDHGRIQDFSRERSN